MPALKTRDSNVPGAYVRITRTKQRKEPEGQEKMTRMRCYPRGSAARLTSMKISSFAEASAVVGSRRSLARVPFTFAVSDGSSSLQILASALEKLRAPPPDRPNTAVRFKSLPSPRDIDAGHSNATAGRGRSPIIVSQSIMGSSTGGDGCTQSLEVGVVFFEHPGRYHSCEDSHSQFYPFKHPHRMHRLRRYCLGIWDDSAKLLIMDMLKQLGARVLGSVGQTLTHIVYKNGRPGTVAHYQPAPMRVETPYLIHIDDMTNTAVKPSRRMRMWSVPALKEVPPLEMARLRKKELPDA
ncbi:hypothetical protein B0H14DRAFT_2774274 [Mycena olivaceomarginata]|nr:hypothetical protein B0H14DRAFT_2774274 [Mycena olivaceomarginata]